jgi:hypothetical protein
MHGWLQLAGAGEKARPAPRDQLVKPVGYAALGAGLKLADDRGKLASERGGVASLGGVELARQGDGRSSSYSAGARLRPVGQPSVQRCANAPRTQNAHLKRRGGVRLAVNDAADGAARDAECLGDLALGAVLRGLLADFTSL